MALPTAVKSENLAANEGFGSVSDWGLVELQRAGDTFLSCTLFQPLKGQSCPKMIHPDLIATPQGVSWSRETGRSADDAGVPGIWATTSLLRLSLPESSDHKFREFCFFSHDEQTPDKLKSPLVRLQMTRPLPSGGAAAVEGLDYNRVTSWGTRTPEHKSDFLPCMENASGRDCGAMPSLLAECGPTLTVTQIWHPHQPQQGAPSPESLRTLQISGIHVLNKICLVADFVYKLLVRH